MRPNKTAGTIVVVTLLVVLLCVMVPPAVAKTYYTFDGHAAVRYDHGDISPALQPYVDYVEYDLICAPGSGVRLYLTSYGKNSIKYSKPGVLESVAYSVMSAPEWNDQRSTASIKSEIYQHALWGRTIVHIEYYYQDLQWWEVPYKNL